MSQPQPSLSASRPAGGGRAAQRAAIRQALIDAGRSCLAESDYVATRVEDIAARASASAATFYLHLPTKRDLLLEFVAELAHDVTSDYVRLDEVVGGCIGYALACPVESEALPG